MKKPVPITKFGGLDLRRHQAASDARTARIATNVDLTLGQEYKARDPVRHLMSLDPASKGLYAVSGSLRAAAPGGAGIPLTATGPVRVIYDQLGGPTQLALSITAGVVQTSTQIDIVGATWPAWAVGGTLTIYASVPVVLTVLARSSDGLKLTVDAPWAEASLNTYRFTLVNGIDSMTSVTASITSGSNRVVFSSGVLPLDMRQSVLSLPSAGFSAAVVFRVSNTELQVDAPYTGGTLTDVAYAISNIATAYPANTLLDVTAVETVGAEAQFGAYPYLTVKRLRVAGDPSQGEVYEHHWITGAAVDPVVAPNTLVALPFSPGASLLQMSGKLWAVDDVNGVVRFSSSEFGPRNWIAPADAGFIPIITHQSGDRKIQSLGVYDSKLAVISEDAVQLWATDPQPSNITFVRTMNGPGTSAAKSVVNVVGDLFYFTAGGFRSLYTQAISNQIKEDDDIGSRVVPLTQLETPSAARALWSQSRGQYLCAFGTRVYAYRHSPQSKVKGWTTWELAHPVDAWVELHGVLYFRSGNELYCFDAKSVDEVVAWDVMLNDFTGGDATENKEFTTVDVLQTGNSELTVAYDLTGGADGTEPINLVGTTTPGLGVYLGGVAKSVAFRFTGTGPWTLSTLFIRYLPLQW